MYVVNRSAVLLIALASVVHASAGKAAGPNDVPPGAIILMRDVPNREAQNHEPPGTPHFVETAPQQIVSGLLTSSLTPLTDEAAGSISASTGGAIARSLSSTADEGAILDALNTLGGNKTGGGGQFGSALANLTMQATSPIGNMIGSALASVAIPSVGH